MTVDAAAGEGSEPGDEANDSTLVVRAGAGDRQGLAKLYDRHAATMVALALRVLGERQAAEDVVHDAFLELSSSAATYGAVRGPVRTWLTMRVRSRALDRLRAEGRRSGSSKRPSCGRDEGGTDPYPFDHEQARAAVAALPAPQRLTLELAYFEGLSGGEISSRLRIPLDTVKSRLAAALAQLRARRAVK